MIVEFPFVSCFENCYVKRCGVILFCLPSEFNVFWHRFEDDKHVSGMFEELWEENTSSERIALQLYLGEVVSLICESIASSSWSSKKKVDKYIYLSLFSL